MIIPYTAFCPIPNDQNRVLIGTTTGALYIGFLRDLSEKSFERSNIWSCLENLEEIDLTDYDLLESPIRNLIPLSDTEIVGHSYNGDIFIFDYGIDVFPINILQRGRYGSDYNVYQIASINSNQFITCGNYGSFWIFNRDQDGEWIREEIADFSNHAHFALEVYDYDTQQYITNNFKGYTRILSNSGEVINSLNGFGKNLQNLIILDNIIAAVDYFGYTHIYSKASDADNRYINVQSIDCNPQTRIYPHILYHLDHFYSAFPTALWKIDPTLSIIQNVSLECKDLNVINNEVVVLTGEDLVLVNEDLFETPDDFINYKYINVGIVGFTDTGKSTFCYKLIYDEYKDDLKTTSGTLIWNLDLEESKKVFIKDLPGQHDEINYYFPKLKNCDLIIAMCKIKDSITPWKNTIAMCVELRENIGVENFIFIRSKSDDREKARKNTIMETLEEEGFNPDYLVDVSAKEGDGIEDIKEILKQDIFWEECKISVENRIKTQLLTAIGSVRATNNEKIKMEHLEVPGFESINPDVLESFVKKLSEEDLIYYIPNRKEILLDTETMGEIESFLLNLFSEREGLYYEADLKRELKQEFNSIEEEDLLYYYEQFINYLEDSDKLLLLADDVFIIKEKLRNSIDIQSNLLCTEFKIKNNITVSQILNFIEKEPLKIKDVSKNQIKFIDTIENGELIVEFCDLSLIDLYEKTFHFKIYIKTSDTISIFFEKLYEEIRNFELLDLPKILNFNNIPEDPLEGCISLFNYPDEAPMIDFKREINYQRGGRNTLSEAQKEILKDIIALGNSSFSFKNTAYLVLGVEESGGKFVSFNNIERQDVIFQQIASLTRRYVKTGFNISHIRLKVYRLHELKNERKIRVQVPLSVTQVVSSCEDELMIIKITRNPNACLELREDIKVITQRGIKEIKKGKSWIRMGSHTFDILNEERRELLRN